MIFCLKGDGGGGPETEKIRYPFHAKHYHQKYHHHHKRKADPKGPESHGITNNGWKKPLASQSGAIIILFIIVLALIIIINIIIITRPKPAYGRHGVARSWVQDQIKRESFGVFSMSHFAPQALSWDINKPGTIQNQPEIMKSHENRPGTLKITLEPWKTIKPHLEPWKINREPWKAIKKLTWNHDNP